MEWAFGFIAIILLVIGLVGQGFEMRRIRKSITRDEDLSSANVFGDKRNYKWYAMIAVALILWFIAERT